jgi:peptide/nickel transport system permease protein
VAVETTRVGALSAANVLPAGRKRHWRRFRNRNLLIGGAMIGMILLAALLAPLISPYNPQKQDYAITQQPPSLAHPFGTDNFGRDVFTRVLYGARIDLRVGLISVIPPFIIGIVLGALAAYYGGLLDTLIMRLADIVQSFPFIVLVIAIVAVLGPGLTNMYIAVALIAWIVYARLIRSEVLVEKQKEYVVAARACGNTDWRILKLHLLPNVISSSIVFAMADIALYILLAASLSFLGLGAKPPMPEWGAMITEGRDFITTSWWMSALPGLAIVVTGVALSFVGDGLADALRPEAE